MFTSIRLLCGSLGFVNLERGNMKRVVLSAVLMFFLFPFKGYAGILNVIDSIPTQFNQNGSGIAWDGSTFWTQSGNQLYQYNLNGDILGSFSTPNGAGFTIGSFTSDQVSIFGLGYASGGADKLTLYQMDFSGNLLFSGQTELTNSKGMAWDGTYLRAMSNKTFYTLDTNGNTINSFDVPSLPASGYGLAYDGQSFITDVLSYDRIYRIDAQNGTILDSIFIGVQPPQYMSGAFYGVPDFYLLNQNFGGPTGVVDFVQIDWTVPAPPFVPEPSTFILAAFVVGLMLRRKRLTR